MNLYTVEIDDWTWDCYDSWVVAAETEEEAFYLCNWADANPVFKDATITVIGTSIDNKPGAILGSFNAG